MADKKKEEVDPIIEAAKEAEVIEEKAEKPLGMKLTKPPVAGLGSAVVFPDAMNIEEILAAKKAEIRAAAQKKQAIIDKKQSAAKK